MIILKVEGMTCGHCQKQVEEIFQNTTGVNEVVVNLEEGSAQISFNENETNEATLRIALNDTNYTIV